MFEQLAKPYSVIRFYHKKQTEEKSRVNFIDLKLINQILDNQLILNYMAKSRHGKRPMLLAFTELYIIQCDKSSSNENNFIKK